MKHASLCIAAVVLAWAALAPAASAAPAAPSPYFKIQVVDDQTGRGVPLVELRTVHNIRHVTDSAGLVAFREPGLMDQRVFFHVKSHGYEFPKDGFGYRGVALEVKEGGSAQLKIHRLNIAERLYRVTGGGIYADSLLLGEPVPLRHPALNGQVLGQDSVMTALYRGKIYWFWGDTARPSYPLGHFQMSGATSLLPGQGGLDPSVGVDLTYFVDDKGFSRKMCPMTRGDIPIMVWLDGFTTVRDAKGEERLIARYTQMKSLAEMLEQGLALFNDRTETFEKVLEFDLKDRWRHPQGRPIVFEEGGRPYRLFPTPYPTVRVAADLASARDPAAYEAFTCLVPGTRYDKASAKVERGADGKAVWAWKRGTDPITQAEEKDLIAAGRLTADEAHFQLADADTGQPVQLHGGTIYWNAYRGRWVMIGLQSYGTSMVGEVWFAEAAAPVGPWRWARKIVTHDQYSFYHPAQHPYFDQEGGRIIYFEGTYAETFSGNPLPTPRYDYNQIMYRLDLADPRLKGPLGPPPAPAAPAR